MLKLYHTTESGKPTGEKHYPFVSVYNQNTLFPKLRYTTGIDSSYGNMSFYYKLGIWLYESTCSTCSYEGCLLSSELYSKELLTAYDPDTLEYNEAPRRYNICVTIPHNKIQLYPAHMQDIKSIYTGGITDS